MGKGSTRGRSRRGNIEGRGVFDVPSGKSGVRGLCGDGMMARPWGPCGERNAEGEFAVGLARILRVVGGPTGMKRASYVEMRRSVAVISGPIPVKLIGRKEEVAEVAIEDAARGSEGA